MIITNYLTAWGAVEAALGDLEAAMDSGLLSSATGNEFMDALGGVARDGGVALGHFAGRRRGRDCRRTVAAGRWRRAVTQKDYPESLQEITLVELSRGRTDRLSEALNEILSKGVIPVPGIAARGAVSPAATERLRAAGYSSENKPRIFIHQRR